MRPKRLTLAVSAALVAMAGAGCVMQPGEPLIAMKERPATVLPTEVAEVRPDDGFPVILADPVSVAGLPRTAESVAADSAALESRRVASEARAGRIAGTQSHAAELARIGRTHADDVRREIEAGARPQQTGEAEPQPAAATGTLPATAAAAPADAPEAPAIPAAEAGPARPVGPAAPYVTQGAVAPR